MKKEFLKYTPEALLQQFEFGDEFRVDDLIELFLLTKSKMRIVLDGFVADGKLKRVRSHGAIHYVAPEGQRKKVVGSVATPRASFAFAPEMKGYTQSLTALMSRATESRNPAKGVV